MLIMHNTNATPCSSSQVFPCRSSLSSVTPRQHEQLLLCNTDIQSHPHPFWLLLSQMLARTGLTCVLGQPSAAISQCEADLFALTQVGGDGLFQEIMNGLLDLRTQGGDMAAVAASMRLGHIPAGSTDAVAYSINGTRSQLTAALHIALGDRSLPCSHSPAHTHIAASSCPVVHSKGTGSPEPT